MAVFERCSQLLLEGPSFDFHDYEREGSCSSLGNGPKLFFVLK